MLSTARISRSSACSSAGHALYFGTGKRGDISGRLDNVVVRGVVHDSGGCTSPGSTGIPFDVNIFGALLSLPDVEELVVFGSWIRRLLTKVSPAARDLDLLIVGSVERRVAYEEIRLIEMRVDLPVDSIFVLPEELVDKTDPFLAELFTSPHIHLKESLQKWI